VYGFPFPVQGLGINQISWLTNLGFSETGTHLAKSGGGWQ
jgi:hypothetical protein